MCTARSFPQLGELDHKVAYETLSDSSWSDHFSRRYLICVFYPRPPELVVLDQGVQLLSQRLDMSTM